MNLFKYTFLTLIIASATSCAKDDLFNNAPTRDINFEANVAQQPKSRASLITPDNQTQYLTSFGVYAIAQSEDIAYGDEASYLLYGDKVSYNKEYDAWSYENYAQWPVMGDAVEFMAYSPYENEGYTPSMNEAGQLEINYHTYPTNIDEQVDLLVSDKRVQADNGTNVPINFKHALSAIAFRFEGSNAIKINSIGFRGGCTSAVMAADAEGIEWSKRVVDAKAFFGVAFEDGHNQISDSEDLSTAENGDYIVMIPYDKVPSLKIEISYTSTSDKTYSALIYPKDDVAWEAGNIYTYTINVEDDVVDESLENIKFGSELEITPWIAGADGDSLTSTTNPAKLDSRSELSNCYMIDSKAQIATYYIPVDERIYEFWGGYQKLTGEDLENYTLDEDDDWYVDVVWFGGDFMELTYQTDLRGEIEYSPGISTRKRVWDNDTDDWFFDSDIFDDDTFGYKFMNFSRLDPASDEYKNLPRNSRVLANNCTNNYVTHDAKAIMKIEIDWSRAFVDNINGNVVVAVKKRIGTTETILWTWHFWVTDYNPNIEPMATETEGNFTVQRGNVHQYKDAANRTDPPIWAFGGLYADKYMMDRNIGMGSVKRNRYDDARGTYNNILYYQFGRKEPFPYFGASSTTVTDYHRCGKNFSSVSRVSSYYADPTMKDAIQHPTYQYRHTTSTTTAYYTTWLNDPVEDDTKCIWSDINVPYKNENVSLYQTRKSIFDPSPLGWMIPVYDVWNGFNDRKLYLEGDENFSHEETVGVTFNKYIFFPYTGYYNHYFTSSNEASTYLSYSAWVSLWSANSSSTRAGKRFGLLKSGTSFVYSVDYTSSYGYGYETCAMPIRCVQE